MKREITGKAVIYTADGVKVISCEVRRYFNVYQEERRPKFKFEGEYLLIDAARTVSTDNIYAKPAYKPEVIQRAVNFAESKFFRLTLDLMRLAQWEPINTSNLAVGYDIAGIDYDKRGSALDTQLYKNFGFTPAMIDFTEARYK